MANTEDTRRYRDNLQDEIDAAGLYRTAAETETQPQLAEIYRRMAEVEEKHAAYWEEQLRAAGVEPGPRRPGWRSRAMSWLARRFGVQFVLPTAIGREDAGRGKYSRQPEARRVGMEAEERSHAKLLNLIAKAPVGGLAGSALVKLEGRHRNIGGNALRAAVLGANDGLCSNLSLVMAVAGANLTSHDILITGLAGLLAGAFSMAMGEWLSVQSSRELYQHELATEADELAKAPEEEMEELSLIYQSKGVDELDARRMAQSLIGDADHALDTLAREELGFDPEELGGSAWEAAGASFVLFVVGAIIPVFAFMFLEGRMAVGVSLAVSTAALYLIGAAISLITGRGVVRSGVRQVIFGLGAAGVTFGIGRLIGVAISG
ncbi:MAG: VIT1/CCC1 family protein [bacterium]|nr:VIT1/CCC1 family protein [bacterium]